ncbi:MAG: coaD [Rickettsiales bacterium]|jgi:pantetheine-phosphate adenylyltransferase|nr:coaD [Rickettsiales bacterium]
MSPSVLCAIYPGTFDPITVGHESIIRRALKIADKLIIAIAADTAKTPIFNLDERVEMVKESLKPLTMPGKTLEVKGFEGLLVDFAKRNGASVIIRGLRAVSDFEYEFQMSCMNTRLSPDIETIFLPASEDTHFIASRFVKEIARLNGDISELVSSNVAQKLNAYYSAKRT